MCRFTMMDIEYQPMKSRRAQNAIDLLELVANKDILQSNDTAALDAEYRRICDKYIQCEWRGDSSMARKLYEYNTHKILYALSAINLSVRNEGRKID